MVLWLPGSMTTLATRAGEPPSVSAYGAIVAGFARRQDAQAGLEAFRRFLSAGGTPDRMMYDTVLSLCIKCELYKSARQVRQGCGCVPRYGTVPIAEPLRLQQFAKSLRLPMHLTL